MNAARVMAFSALLLPDEVLGANDLDIAFSHAVVL